MSTETSANRVRKLLALARNNPSIKEAAAAFARAQEIAARHQLDLEDLAATPDAPPRERTVQGVVEREIEHFKRVPVWKVLLAEAIADANRCKVWYAQGPDGAIGAYGQPSDLDTVEYMYAAVRKEVDRLASAASKGKGSSWKRNFRIGAVDEIRTRLHAATRKAVRELQSEAFKVGGETALARVSQALQHDARVRDAVADFGEELGVLDPKPYDHGGYGYGDGRRAGKGVTLGNTKGGHLRAVEGGK